MPPDRRPGPAARLAFPHRSRNAAKVGGSQAGRPARVRSHISPQRKGSSHEQPQSPQGSSAVTAASWRKRSCVRCVLSRGMEAAESEMGGPCGSRQRAAWCLLRRPSVSEETARGHVVASFRGDGVIWCERVVTGARDSATTSQTPSRVAGNWPQARTAGRLPHRGRHIKGFSYGHSPWRSHPRCRRDRRRDASTRGISRRACGPARDHHHDLVVGRTDSPRGGMLAR
jgi:hypothetical protein